MNRPCGGYVFEDASAKISVEPARYAVVSGGRAARVYATCKAILRRQRIEVNIVCNVQVQQAIAIDVSKCRRCAPRLGRNMGTSSCIAKSLARLVMQQ